MINKILLKIIINWVYSNPKNTVPASVSRPAVASLWRPPISVVLTLETNLFAVCQDGFKRLFRKRFFFLISLLDLWTSKVPYCYCTCFFISVHKFTKGFTIFIFFTDEILYSSLKMRVPSKIY